MTKLTFDMAVSLDGFIAGPSQRTEAPLGDGGERLHQWKNDAEGKVSPDSEIVEEHLANTGAMIMGRGMFGGGEGPWDEASRGPWGDEPPFHMPVFVLTHHAREPLTMQGGTTFTFVTDGIGSALDQAKEAADGKDVQIGGGGNVASQYLKAGLVDEFQVHVSPILLGAGSRLFGNANADPVDLEVTRVVQSPTVTHMKYSVAR